ncbi:hypothetical protein SEA_MOOSEHEAD_27 [Gordonia phage Moosehead]|nr:hypothetical protein SEA_MOOSEHEAD_27 [Gordonia phage Moosehead]
MRIEKDPNAKLDYGIDWTDWLKQRNGSADQITDSTWTITGPDTALIQTDSSFSTTQTGVWLSAGTNGGTYSVTNHVTTAAGREDDRTLTIAVKQR